VLPEKSPPREQWLTRSQAAQLIRAAWRAKQVMRVKDTKRDVGKHIARFALVGLYTGTRHGAICGAALHPAIGRGYVDVERGLFYRRAQGARETKKRQPPVRLPQRLLAHLRRWHRLGIATHAVVEWNGKPVRSVRRGFRCRRARSQARRACHAAHSPTYRRDMGDAGRGRSMGDGGLSRHDGRDVGANLRPPSPGSSGRCCSGHRWSQVRATEWRQNGREQTGTNGSKADKNRRKFRARAMSHSVRDVGVAGSNPATPTIFLALLHSFTNDCANDCASLRLISTRSSATNDRLWRTRRPSTSLAHCRSGGQS